MKKLFKFVLWSVVLLVVIVVAVSVSSGGGGDDTAATGSGDTTAAGGTTKAKGLDPEAEAENKVAKGAAFQLGDFKVLKGWKVKKVGFGLGYEIKSLDVQNTTSDEHGFDVTFKLHQGPNRIVSNIDCIADQAKPNQIVTATCLADGEGNKPYNFITVGNTY